jgi:hypothetical protein
VDEGLCRTQTSTRTRGSAAGAAARDAPVDMTSCLKGHERGSASKADCKLARAVRSLNGKDAMLEDLDRRLQYGPGMRVQRGVEAALLLTAFWSGDPRWALGTVVLTALQVVSPRLVPVALVVAGLSPPPRAARLSDVFFDYAGSRGACALSVVMQAVGLWLAMGPSRVAGFAVLSIPLASFLLSATVGFCAGCACYVAAREIGARIGLLQYRVEGASDVDIIEETPDHQR